MKNNAMRNLKYHIKNSRLTGWAHSLEEAHAFIAGVTKAGTKKQEPESGKYSVGLAERARRLVRGWGGNF